MDLACRPTTELDTDGFPHPFDSWRERIETTYDISVPPDQVDRFRVIFKGWSLGSVGLTYGEFSAQVFRRDAAKVRHDQLDQYGLFAQGIGQRLSTAGGQERIIRPGEIQFFDMAQEEVSVAEQGTSGTMLLPREVVEDVLPDAAHHHGVVLKDGAARILASYILSVGEQFANVPASAVPAIANASLELALGCLTGALGASSTLPNQAFQLATRRRIERYVNDRLGDPLLSASQIQAEFGLSRSALYRLFESSHGVGRFIKYRRLARIRAILVENRDTRTLATLAADFGFQSGAHFSREFQRQFGCSPSEVRSGASFSVLPAGHIASIEALYRSIQP